MGGGMDRLYEILFLGGLVVAALGWLWLLGAAFRTHRRWGLLVLLVPPAALLFAAKHWPRAKAPLGVVAAGLLISAAPAIYTRVAPIDLGPRREIVDGEVHITLTGWDRQDYAVLRQMPDVVVLQMANPDVTDETLRMLANCPRLKELDVSDSQVTDAGLVTLAQLPELAVLRLQNCRVTDAGFREHLAPLPKLLRVDLTGTQVTPEAVREWRKANPERRALQ
jgi:hypothetical protein